MLADLVDHVIGVDPDRDRITAVAIDAARKGEVDRIEVSASPAGHETVMEWADGYSEATARVWSIDGAGSYGAGLCATLQAEGEWVVEFDHPESRSDQDGAKSEGRDAARAGREVLGRSRLATPRSRGPKEGLRTLMVARRGAERARVAAVNGLKALVVTAPMHYASSSAG